MYLNLKINKNILQKGIEMNTPNYTKLAETTMRVAAKEKVTCEKIKGTLYVYGSELACLRIFAKFNGNGAFHNTAIRYGYSHNLKTHYFSLDLPC
jgi:hypothetical protein